MKRRYSGGKGVKKYKGKKTSAEGEQFTNAVSTYSGKLCGAGRQLRPWSSWGGGGRAGRLVSTTPHSRGGNRGRGTGQRVSGEGVAVVETFPDEKPYPPLPDCHPTWQQRGNRGAETQHGFCVNVL